MIVPPLQAAVVFSESYLALPTDADERRSINRLAGEINRNGKQFLNLLDEQSAFKGFYLKLEDRESLDSDFYDRRIALEMELFDEGWREASRELAKKKQQTRLEYLQMQSDMAAKRADNVHYYIKLIQNRIYYDGARRQRAFYSALYEKRKRKLAEGYIEQSELIDAALKRDRAKTDYDYYAGTAMRAIPLAWFNLLNRAEAITLQGEDRLLALAKENSYELKIQALLESRTEFYPQYLDNVSMRLFVERRENNRILAATENIVGVRVRLPIDFDSKRTKIVGIQRDAYGYRKEVVLVRLQEKISAARQLLGFKQRSLKNLQQEDEALSQQAVVARKQMQADLTGLKYTPERKLDEINMQQLTLSTRILLTRLEILDVLLKLQSLTQVDDFNALLDKPSPVAPADRLAVTE
ncbi:MAG TPA: hypothetical protein ENJ64_05785 [Thiotrichales bacterium]|nr:hypothetical protein [Thiotrichales bacterium]